jgi:hypothetical protein
MMVMTRPTVPLALLVLVITSPLRPALVLVLMARLAVSTLPLRPLLAV